MNNFMDIAIEEAILGSSVDDGGPFGAVIVRDNEIIAVSHSEVIKTNDPTAHAEIVAIRKATEQLGRFDLSDCEIYSSCEPCPMCLSAIYWAKIPKLYFAATRKNAKDIGFDDEYIYDVLQGKIDKPKLETVKVNGDKCQKVMFEWSEKPDKQLY